MDLQLDFLRAILRPSKLVQYVMFYRRSRQNTPPFLKVASKGFLSLCHLVLIIIVIFLSTVPMQFY